MLLLACFSFVSLWFISFYRCSRVIRLAIIHISLFCFISVLFDSF